MFEKKTSESCETNHSSALKWMNESDLIWKFESYVCVGAGVGLRQYKVYGKLHVFPVLPLKICSERSDARLEFVVGWSGSS